VRLLVKIKGKEEDPILSTIESIVQIESLRPTCNKIQCWIDHCCTSSPCGTRNI